MKNLATSLFIVLLSLCWQKSNAAQCDILNPSEYSKEMQAYLDDFSSGKIVPTGKVTSAGGGINTSPGSTMSVNIPQPAVVKNLSAGERKSQAALKATLKEQRNARQNVSAASAKRAKLSQREKDYKVAQEKAEAKNKQQVKAQNKRALAKAGRQYRRRPTITPEARKTLSDFNARQPKNKDHLVLELSGKQKQLARKIEELRKSRSTFNASEEKMFERYEDILALPEKNLNRIQSGASARIAAASDKYRIKQPSVAVNKPGKLTRYVTNSKASPHQEIVGKKLNMPKNHWMHIEYNPPFQASEAHQALNGFADGRVNKETFERLNRMMSVDPGSVSHLYLNDAKKYYDNMKGISPTDPQAKKIHRYYLNRAKDYLQYHFPKQY